MIEIINHLIEQVAKRHNTPDAIFLDEKSYIQFLTELREKLPNQLLTEETDLLSYKHPNYHFGLRIELKKDRIARHGIYIEII